MDRELQEDARLTLTVLLGGRVRSEASGCAGPGSLEAGARGSGKIKAHEDVLQTRNC